LRSVTPEAATGDLVAIKAPIYRAAGVPFGPATELDLEECGFPPEMLGLRLGALLRLILFIAPFAKNDGLRGPSPRRTS
jgi:hypothetical protein